MLFAARQSWLLATLCFTLAAAFRSNGIVLAGYLVWGLVAHPFLTHRNISLPKSLYALLLSTCVFLPFLYHNYTAYLLFCFPPHSTPTPQWCTHTPPSIYTHVQSTYWNVGFLRYWSPSQIPNFILGAPPLALLIAFSVSRLVIIAPGVLASLRGSPQASVVPDAHALAPTSILPHILHTLFMCTTLLFFSHTQIVLRLAAALPTLYWGAAWLLVRDLDAGNHRKTSHGWPWGKIWVWWSALWGTASLALWAAFLPPA
ncbi:hypothetical protein DXG03_003886 [Asterophora parasitica]|uniref:GPI mannosyltransferase 2 n=1 Tax=Asterophora parasitica TaxID=117018 RepID=A0A9P7KEE3_9AGAR|nr:hypothetical protein DXG03_003886 [Asterophora parasitica]